MQKENQEVQNVVKKLKLESREREQGNEEMFHS